MASPLKETPVTLYCADPTNAIEQNHQLGYERNGVVRCTVEKCSSDSCPYKKVIEKK